MKRTHQAFRYTNGAFKYMGIKTCECTGEWSNKVKSWTEVGDFNGNQYSLMYSKRDRKYYFILEAVN